MGLGKDLVRLGKFLRTGEPKYVEAMGGNEPHHENYDEIEEEY